MKPLTLDTILAAAEALGDYKPPRIIVDSPLVARDAIGTTELEGRELVLIGSDAWDTVRATAIVTTLEKDDPPAILGGVDTLGGVRVEFFDYNNAEHRAIARALVERLIAASPRRESPWYTAPSLV